MTLATREYEAAQRASAAPKPATGLGWIFLDDGGMPDLTKIQMLAWTFNAALIFVTQVLTVVATVLSASLLASQADATAVLPTIPAALLGLMGPGHLGYLGNKLTLTTTPRITGISPAGRRHSDDPLDRQVVRQPGRRRGYD